MTLLGAVRLGAAKAGKPAVVAARRPSTTLAPVGMFDEVLALIEAARRRAYQAVNSELVSLYWQLGDHISRKVASAEWGDGVVDELAATIARQYPGMPGYTRPNLFRMRQFYEAYRGDKKVSSLMRQLPWTHHLVILGQAKLPEERRFYVLEAITANWTVRELERQIRTHAFRRRDLKPGRVSAALAQAHPTAIDQVGSIGEAIQLVRVVGSIGRAAADQGRGWDRGADGAGAGRGWHDEAKQRLCFDAVEALVTPDNTYKYQYFTSNTHATLVSSADGATIALSGDDVPTREFSIVLIWPAPIWPRRTSTRRAWSRLRYVAPRSCARRSPARTYDEPISRTQTCSRRFFATPICAEQYWPASRASQPHWRAVRGREPHGRDRPAVGDRRMDRYRRGRADNNSSYAALQLFSRVSPVPHPRTSALIRLDPACRSQILPRPIQTLLRYRDRRCYGHPVTSRAAVVPRIATGKVVDGKIVTRTKFPDGTKLILQVEEPAPVVELDAEDERAIDRALASVREGRGISLDKFRAILQRL